MTNRAHLDRWNQVAECPGDRVGSNGQARARAQPSPRTGRWWGWLCGFVANMDRLSPAAHGVWLALFRFSVDGESQIGIDQITKVTGIGVATVRRMLRELIGKGFISVVKRGGRNRGTTRYRLRYQTINHNRAQVRH